MYNKLCIFSYNSRGFNTDKQVFCCKLLRSSGSSTTILCNQENFLLKANGYIEIQALPDHGMFIAIPEVMKESVTDISPSHWRIQTAIIKKKNSEIMIINSYFPQDSKSTTNTAELKPLLAVINSLLMNYNFHRNFRLHIQQLDVKLPTSSIRTLPVRPASV